MKTRPAHSPPWGFTLVEVLIASAIAVVLIGGVYSVLYCANILTYKNFATNSTGTEARNALDHLQGVLQTAYSVPVPIDATGAALSGSLTITGAAAVASGLAPVMSGSAAVITGTGPGIKFYRYVGGPYVVTVPTGGLPGTATSVTIELDNSALPPPPIPQANDILLINTTVVPTVFQTRATVTGSTTLTGTNGTKIKYSVLLTPPMKDPNGTPTSPIPYQTDNQGAAISCSASLLRPTAFVIVINGVNKELRMFDSYATDGSGKVILSGSNYTTLTRAIDTGTTTLSQFGVVTMGSQTFVGLVLRIRSTDYDNYLANKQNDGFCTYMGLNVFIALKSKP
ncbi:MAG: prepilin-type N-terminal cleavage/methylation domain-containing protein [Verrucomicrobia bacterium]|nr:prepilin-type N-terminal cleavage/methylation domain-containing protein [Verrucomicrobiota bacterium]